MEYRTLGNTGLLVSRLSLGTMTFAGQGLYKMIGRVDQPQADVLVKTALDAGINLFDSADVYSAGESEQTLGQSFKNLAIARKDILVATKTSSRAGTGVNDMGSSRGHIMDSVEASLRRLQTDYIDLFQIHANDDVTPIEETLRALDDLVSQGKVRYVGVSNWQAWKIATSFGISHHNRYARFETVQAYYSIAGRDIEREIVPLLTAEKAGLLVWSPLAGGLLSGKFSRANQKPAGSRRSDFDFPIVNKERVWNVIEAIEPIAKAHDSSVARIALAWILSKPFVTSIVLGAKRLDQLEDNLFGFEDQTKPGSDHCAGRGQCPSARVPRLDVGGSEGRPSRR